MAILLQLAMSAACLAANLVSNPGFESYSSLPNCNSIPSSFSANLATGWISTADGTSDYLNTASGTLTSCLNFTPSPHSGAGHVGFAMGRPSQGTYREYVQTGSLSLTQGTPYDVDFWVKRADGSDAATIGVFFSTSAPSTVFGNTPQVSAVIPATGVYIHVVGSFTPQTSGTYSISIGPYNTNSITSLNYFYVDDVNVSPCLQFGTITQQPADGDDVPSGVMTLTVGLSNTADVTSYQWQRLNPDPTNLTDDGTYSGTGTSSLTIHAGNDYCAAGYYQCVVTYPCGTVITRQALLSCPAPVIVYRSADTTVTEGGRAVLTVVPATPELPCQGPYTYFWNDDTRHISLAEPHTNQLIFDPVTVSNSGRYSCVVMDSCGETISQQESLRVLRRGRDGTSSDWPKRIATAPWLRTGGALTTWATSGVKVEFGTNAVGGRMRVCLYDLQGKRVSTLFDGELPAATSRTVSWDGRNRTGTAMRPGVYWVRATLNAFSITEKVVSVR